MMWQARPVRCGPATAALEGQENIRVENVQSKFEYRSKYHGHHKYHIYWNMSNQIFFLFKNFS